MTYRQGQCSYRHASSIRQINVGRVLVLNTPPAWMASKSTGSDFQIWKTSVEITWRMAMGKNREYAQLPPVVVRK